MPTPAWAGSCLALAIALLVAPSSAAHPDGTSGSCATGTARAQLDANNVRADLYNTGALFYPPGPGYEVPTGSGVHALFAAQIWVGGLVDDELRLAAAMYERTDLGNEFYPGPLDEDGTPPTPDDCSQYDRIYRIGRSDLDAYEQNGTVSDALRDWPYQLGAPVVDGDGDPDNYDLQAGDRPALYGDQTLWWVMNDAAGPHLTTGAPAIGLEIQVTAYATASDDAVDDATIYRYKLTYRGAETLRDAYFGLWVDPDLGNYQDDFVGVDTLREIAFVFNGDDLDDGGAGYGARPPALGIDLFQGPLADADRRDNDADGVTDEPGERQPLSHFVAIRDHSAPTGPPQEAAEFYAYMRGRWRDGSPVTHGGWGHGGSQPAHFMFPGQPPDFWSMENVDSAGTSPFPEDLMMLASTGPFTMEPGETQELVYGIIWARGANRLASISAMQRAANLVQERFGFGQDDPVALPDAPSAPVRQLSPADGATEQPVNAQLVWESAPEATWYEVQLTGALPFENDDLLPAVYETSLVASLDSEKTQYWRVRAANDGGPGPWSETLSISTSSLTLPGPFEPGFALGTGIVEVANPSAPGGKPCIKGDDPIRGCEEYGGDAVWHDLNSTSSHYVSGSATGKYDDLLDHIEIATPRDFEVRFTAEGGFGVYAFSDGRVARTPFELWDIGVGTPNDPADDLRMIPFLRETGGAPGASWGWAVGVDTYFGRPASDAIYWMDPQDEHGYEQFAAVAVATGAGNIYPADTDGSLEGYFVDFHGDMAYPIGNVIFGDFASAGVPSPGTTVRFVTDKQPPPLQPIASAPGSNAVVSNPVLLWWQHAPSDQVDLQIATEAGFQNVVEEVLDAGAPPYRPRNLEAGQTYFWRLRSRNQAGQSDWSTPWSFVAGEGVGAKSVSELPGRLELRQNFPNPFSGATTVRFGLPAPGPVRLEVFDLLGRLVETVVSGTRAAGWHEVNVDGSSLPSGLYFLRLQFAEGVRSLPVTVVR